MSWFWLGWPGLLTARLDSVQLGWARQRSVGLDSPRLVSVVLGFAGLVLAGLDCGGPVIFRLRSTGMRLCWACLGCAWLSWDWVGWARMFLLHWTGLG